MKTTSKSKSTKKVARKTTSGKTTVSKKKTTVAKSSTRVKLDSFVKKNKEQYPTGSWVVFTTPEGKDGKRTAPKVFESSFSRDKVRSTYAKVMGVSMTDTRSRRIENY